MSSYIIDIIDYLNILHNTVKPSGSHGVINRVMTGYSTSIICYYDI